MDKAALLICLVGVLGLLVSDARRRQGVSPALWGVVAWVTVLGSRPVSMWFDPVGSGVASIQSFDDGSPLDRLIFGGLMLHGLWVLSTRHVRLRDVIASNRWLAIFFLYWAVSVVWADAPFIALKRWVKDLGHVVMVLVVLTDARPLEAMKAVFVRSASVLLPLSVVLILFIPQLGMAPNVGLGEAMYIGVATQKNSLGQLVLISLLFLAWDLLRRSPGTDQPLPWSAKVGHLALMGMGGWLMVMASSATSMGCLLLGGVVLAAFSLKSTWQRVRGVEVVAVVAAVSIWAAGITTSALDFFVVDLLGRDLTLTTRTDIWPQLLSRADNAWVGSGFNSFWTGERLADLYAKFLIVQAHNGYLETYLNGGLIGSALLGMVLISALITVHRQLIEGRAMADLALALVLITIAYNFTEATYNKTSPLWFAFLMVVTQYRSLRATSVGQSRSGVRRPSFGIRA